MKLFLLILLLCLVAGDRLSASTPGKRARIVYLENEDMGVVRLKTGRATVLSFPTKPEKVICGNKSVYSIEFVENDVVITPLVAGARSNLFTYLFGRRFGFDLTVTEGEGDEIVVIRDRLQKNERDPKKSKNR